MKPFDILAWTFTCSCQSNASNGKNHWYMYKYMYISGTALCFIKLHCVRYLFEIKFLSPVGMRCHFSWTSSLLAECRSHIPFSLPFSQFSWPISPISVTHIFIRLSFGASEPFTLLPCSLPFQQLVYWYCTFPFVNRFYWELNCFQTKSKESFKTFSKARKMEDSNAFVWTFRQIYTTKKNRTYAQTQQKIEQIVTSKTTSTTTIKKKKKQQHIISE